MKTCTQCKVEKPLTAFYTRSDTGKVRSNCKDCVAIKSKAKWENDSDFRTKGKARSRKHQLYRDYNLTEETYRELLDKQGGKCSICSILLEGTSLRAVVDHCHIKGHVCGILCQNCNSGIGFLQDNATIIKEALKYVERTRK